MYCSSCGTPNPDNATWCAQCGTPLHAPAPATPAPAAPYAPVAAQTAASAVNIPRHTALACFALLCGFCCCFPGFICAIISFVSAMSVNSRLAANDVAGATKASGRAAFWGWLAILCGIVGLIAKIIVGAIYGPSIVEALQHAH